MIAQPGSCGNWPAKVFVKLKRNCISHPFPLDKDAEDDIADEDDDERGDDSVDVDDTAGLETLRLVAVHHLTFARLDVPTKVTKAEAQDGDVEDSGADDQEGEEPDEKTGEESEGGLEEYGPGAESLSHNCDRPGESDGSHGQEVSVGYKIPEQSGPGAEVSRTSVEMTVTRLHNQCHSLKVSVVEDGHEDGKPGAAVKEISEGEVEDQDGRAAPETSEPVSVPEQGREREIIRLT